MFCQLAKSFKLRTATIGGEPYTNHKSWANLLDNELTAARVSEYERDIRT
jgi:hypothetical protein